MQLPAFYFAGALEHPALLAIPTAAPTMLVRGAFVTLERWQWVYAVVFTAATLVGLSVWALRAFEVHVVRKAG
jgi:fluoroquinolone transport system permease protein